MKCLIKTQTYPKFFYKSNYAKGMQNYILTYVC